MPIVPLVAEDQAGFCQETLTAQQHSVWVHLVVQHSFGVVQSGTVLPNLIDSKITHNHRNSSLIIIKAIINTIKYYKILWHNKK